MLALFDETKKKKERIAFNLQYLVTFTFLFHRFLLFITQILLCYYDSIYFYEYFDYTVRSRFVYNFFFFQQLRLL